MILLVIDLGDGCKRPDGFAMPSTGCTHPNPLKVRFTGMLFQHIPNEALNVFLCNFSDFSYWTRIRVASLRTAGSWLW